MIVISGLLWSPGAGAQSDQDIEQALIDGTGLVLEQRAGGTMWGLDLGDECFGYFDMESGLAFDLAAERSLAVFVASDTDTTLALRLPDGSYLCNDDAFGAGSSAVAMEIADPGGYLILAGTFDAEVSELVQVGIADTFPMSEQEELASQFDQVFDQYFDRQLAASVGMNGPQDEEFAIDDFLLDDAAQLARQTLTADKRTTISAVVSLGQDSFTDWYSECPGFGRLSQPATFTSTVNDDKELIFFAASTDTDLTLLVEGPDGTYRCTDDFSGINPLVSFDSTQSGAYSVYVGSFDSDVEFSAIIGAGMAPAELERASHFEYLDTIEWAFGSTDLDTSDSGVVGFTGPQARPLTFLAPLNAALVVDETNRAVAQQINILSNVSLYELSADCSGHGTQAATLSVVLDESMAGETLSIGATSATDSVIAVVLPDGTVTCNDDGPQGLDPLVRINAADAGTYKVWIGGYDNGSAFPARAYAQIGDVTPFGDFDFDAAPRLDVTMVGGDAALELAVPSAEQEDSNQIPIDISMAVLGCQGSLNPVPLVTLAIIDTATAPLTIETDGPLFMLGPDTLVICDPEGSVTFDEILVGDFKVWTGVNATTLSVTN